MVEAVIAYTIPGPARKEQTERFASDKAKLEDDLEAGVKIDWLTKDPEKREEKLHWWKLGRIARETEVWDSYPQLPRRGHGQGDTWRDSREGDTS
jgi:hypothetical protein